MQKIKKIFTRFDRHRTWIGVAALHVAGGNRSHPLILWLHLSNALSFLAFVGTLHLACRDYHKYDLLLLVDPVVLGSILSLPLVRL